ncbi:MAG TPA: PAS domain S-box protein, partial [Tepidiformaceae bacterium]|nr:PAS domain S-box protein [Tepidiformaceae bacterium]
MASVPPMGHDQAIAGGSEAALQDLRIDAGGFASLFAYSADAMAVHRQGVILAVNGACLELLGASSEDLRGRSLTEFLARGRGARSLDCSARKRGRPRVTPVEFVRADGGHVHTDVQCWPVSHSGGPACLLLIRDARVSRLHEHDDRRRLFEAAREALAGQRRSEEALELAEEAAGLGVWDWDVATGRLSWTAGLEPLHGLEPGTFRGTFEQFLEIIDEVDRVNVLREIEAALVQSPGDFETEFRVTHPDGSLHWVLGKGRVMRDEVGRPERMVGIGLDVTERRELREQLAKTLQQLRLVFDSMPSPVAYIDADRCYRLASKAYEQWLGVPLSEVEGKHIEAVIGPTEYAKVLPFLDEVLSGRPVGFEQELVYPGVGRRFVRASLVPHATPDGVVHGYISLVTDETERRRTEQSRELIAASGALLSASLDYEATVASIARVVLPGLADHCAVDVLEEDGRLHRLAVEDSGENYGPLVARLRERQPAYGPGDPRLEVLEAGQTLLFPVVDRPLLAMFAGDDAHLAALEALNLTSIIVAPLHVGQEPLGVLLLAARNNSRTYDELDRQTAEEVARRASTAIANARLFSRTQEVAAVHAEANAAKDEFLALVSHELRTPLTTIAGNADVLLRASGLLSEEQREQALADIKRDSDRLRSLVENMLMLSRIGQTELDLEPIMVPHIVEDLVDVYRGRYETRRFDIILSSYPPVVLAERTCL